jgi:hypothetical protein
MMMKKRAAVCRSSTTSLILVLANFGRHADEEEEEHEEHEVEEEGEEGEEEEEIEIDLPEVRMAFCRLIS